MPSRFFIPLLLLAALTACSQEQQQQVTDQIGQKQALEKARQVEQTMNEKAAADLRRIQEAEAAR
jgi:sensor domain CHASE-containing protein